MTLGNVTDRHSAEPVDTDYVIDIHDVPKGIRTPVAAVKGRIDSRLFNHLSGCCDGIASHTWPPMALGPGKYDDDATAVRERIP